MLSGVSAQDNINSIDANTSETLNEGNFTELNNNLYENTDKELELNKNYSYNLDDDNISIYTSTVINGNGYCLDFRNSTALELKTQSNITLVFNEVTFKNYYNMFYNTGSINITCINCYFINPEIDSITFILEFPIPEENLEFYGGLPSKEIILKAYEIAGDSRDLEAAKKLAVWIKKNFVSEKKAGFYQSPEETLHRLKSNCCCRTLLFFQMCQALGITENHKLYFVHVGTMQFGKRHFFAVIDDICVDVSLNRPWGRGGFFNRSIVSVTEYPYLPIPKTF